MKKLLLFFVLFISVAVANAQIEKYYRIKIFTNDEGLKQLSKQGIGFDHGEYKRGEYYISDFSEQELGLIRNSNYKYEVLINDVSAYYVKRNQEVSSANIPKYAPKGPLAMGISMFLRHYIEMNKYDCL